MKETIKNNNIDFVTYGDEKDEMEYESPKKISKKAENKIKNIKARNLKIGHFAIFKTYSQMMA